MSNDIPGLLTERQSREIEYHREHAARHGAELAERRVPVAIARDTVRRPWNAYWSLYDRLLAWGVKGRRVLVPGFAKRYYNIESWRFSDSIGRYERYFYSVLYLSIQVRNPDTESCGD